MSAGPSGGLSRRVWQRLQQVAPRVRDEVTAPIFSQRKVAVLQCSLNLVQPSVTHPRATEAWNSSLLTARSLRKTDATLDHTSR